MTQNPAEFCERYGPWAVVAGASRGIGSEFARQIAAKGLAIVAVARRSASLEAVADELRREYSVEVRTLSLDLADADAARRIADATAGLDVGLVVYNAAYSPIGAFLELELEDQVRALDVNCRTALGVAHHFGRLLSVRGGGGMILMSSMSARQGSPGIATYAATKAFGLVLGEGLWDELRSRGVDVLAFCAGATRTPNYEASKPRPLGRFAPQVMEPGAVARDALAQLGAGPSAVAGRGNRFGNFIMGRLLSRRRAVELMGRTTRSMYGPRSGGRSPS